MLADTKPQRPQNFVERFDSIRVQLLCFLPFIRDSVGNTVNEAAQVRKDGATNYDGYLPSEDTDTGVVGLP